MSSLDDLVVLNITKGTRTPSRAGFGTPMILAYHTHNTDRVRKYTKLSAMVTDGFSTTEPAYLIAQAIFAQNPRVKAVKVGRRSLMFTQIVDLTPAAPALNKVYTITIGGTVITYTATGVDTLATVCTAIAALITALAGVTATGASGTKVVVTTDAAGAIVTYAHDSKTSNLSMKDTTVDPGIATDLSAVEVADSDWYGLCLDSNSHAEIAAAAAWTEARRYILCAQTCDTAVSDTAAGGDATSIAAVLKTAAYVRTHLDFHPTIGLPTSWISAGILGSRLPRTPGSDTWAYKTLAGIAAYILNDTQEGNLLAKNVGIYTAINDINVTRDGKSSSGEFMDVTRFIDWLVARIKERQFGLFINNEKVPYTEDGITQVTGVLKGTLREGAANGGLDASSIDITAPALEDIDESERAIRNLPGVEFGARLQGAIHTLEIEGTLSV